MINDEEIEFMTALVKKETDYSFQKLNEKIEKQDEKIEKVEKKEKQNSKENLTIRKQIAFMICITLAYCVLVLPITLALIGHFL